MVKGAARWLTLCAAGRQKARRHRACGLNAWLCYLPPIPSATMPRLILLSYMPVLLSLPLPLLSFLFLRGALTMVPHLPARACMPTINPSFARADGLPCASACSLTSTYSYRREEHAAFNVTSAPTGTSAPINHSVVHGHGYVATSLPRSVSRHCALLRLEPAEGGRRKLVTVRTTDMALAHGVTGAPACLPRYYRYLRRALYRSR